MSAVDALSVEECLTIFTYTHMRYINTWYVVRTRISFFLLSMKLIRRTLYHNLVSILTFILFWIYFVCVHFFFEVAFFTQG